MKTLYLVRHAKSDWGDASLPDHDRPLNQRGESDLPRMAAELEARGVRPDVIVTSTAIRARTTALALAAALGVPEDRIAEDGGLYLASPSRILRALSLLPEDANAAMLCGHNPGMHEAVLSLAPQAAVTEFPTLAVAELRLRIGFWGEVSPACGELLHLTVPRSLPG